MHAESSERPPEGNKAAERHIPLALIGEINDEFDRIMLGDKPLVGPVERPRDVDIAWWTSQLESRNRALADYGLEESSWANAVWAYEVEGTELVLFHHSRELPAISEEAKERMKELDPKLAEGLEREKGDSVTETTVMVTRTLGEDETGWEGSSHVRSTYPIKREPYDHGNWCFVNATIRFGVVENGKYRPVDPPFDIPKPGRVPRLPETRVRHRDPSGKSISYDAFFATVAELEVARDLLRYIET